MQRLAIAFQFMMNPAGLTPDALLWSSAGPLQCFGKRALLPKDTQTGEAAGLKMVGLDDAVYNFVMSIPRYRKRYLFVVISSLMGIYMANKRRIDDVITGKISNRPVSSKKRHPSSHKRVGVDAAFLAQLKVLVPICIPGKPWEIGMVTTGRPSVPRVCLANDTGRHPDLSNLA